MNTFTSSMRVKVTESIFMIYAPVVGLRVYPIYEENVRGIQEKHVGACKFLNGDQPPPPKNRKKYQYVPNVMQY
jgi:hypothetical protein